MQKGSLTCAWGRVGNQMEDPLLLTSLLPAHRVEKGRGAPQPILAAQTCASVNEPGEW